VVAYLGEPDTREVTPEFTGFDYPGLSVSFRQGGLRDDSPRVVDGLWTNSPQHCFRGNICPSDTLVDIRKVLGPADIEDQTEDKPKRLFYPLPELEACWLWVFTEDSLTATKIRLACQP